MRRGGKKKLLKILLWLAKKKNNCSDKSRMKGKESVDRRKKSTTKNFTPSAAISVADSGCFGSYRTAQTFGKAIHKAKRNLPLSPRKRLAVVKNLAYEEKLLRKEKKKL